MSIPIRFDVLGPGMLIKRNQSIGTISYGSDLTKRDTWLNYFKTWLPMCPIGNENYAWIKDFDEIYIPNYKFLFKREEII